VEYEAAFSLPGPLGLITGLAATAGMVALGSNLYNKFKGDDIISPGYGKRTLFGPEGSIQLNDKDTVIAGTNLEGNSNSSVNSQSVSPSIDLTPLIERMSAVENILTQIFNKEGNIFLNGTKVGTAMAVSTYKVQ
jgi:ABC-type branched-subunit amino acid transport system ATPase component